MKRSYLVAAVFLSSMSGCGPMIELEDDTGDASTSSPTPDPTTATTLPPQPPPIPPATSTTTSATAPTTSATTVATADSEGSDDISFIMEPDGGTNCVVTDDGAWHCSYCDPFVQDCPDGDKCVPWSADGDEWWDRTRCSPVAEVPVAVGGVCTVEGGPYSGVDDCDLGAMCFGVDPVTLEGTCVAICEGSPVNPECAPDSTCLIAYDGNLVVCLPSCDPLLGDCVGSEACVPATEGFACIPAAGAGPGEPCEHIDVCGPGLTCAPSEAVAATCDPGFEGCCTPWCDLAAPDPAAGCFDPEQVCLPWPDAPAGFEDVGVCALPV